MNKAFLNINLNIYWFFLFKVNQLEQTMKS